MNKKKNYVLCVPELTHVIEWDEGDMNPFLGVTLEGLPNLTKDMTNRWPAAIPQVDRCEEMSRE